MTSVGVIGCGSWGGNWVRTLAGMGDVELRWCCDLNEGLLAKTKQQFPQIRTTTNFDDLLHDSSLSGIVVATIAPTHFNLAQRALKAGKHLLVEKPLTLNSADALALHRQAQAVNRVLMVGHLLEYHPATVYIDQMIRSGELGEVQYLYSHRLNLGKIRTDENAWWSLAPHDISVALRLLGEWPVSIHCHGQNVVQKNVADVVFGMLEFPGGKLAQIHVSWLDPHKTRKLTVVGSKRMVVFDDTLPSYKVTVHDKGFRLNPKKEAGPDSITLTQGDIVTPKIDGTEPLVREARQFIECISTGAKPIADSESGVRVVALLEHGQRSLETGSTVAVPPLGFNVVRARRAA